MGTDFSPLMVTRISFAGVIVFCLGCGTTGFIPQPQPILQPPPLVPPVAQPQSPVWQPQPISYPQPTSPSGLDVFALAGSQEQQSTVRSALSRCTFPFERLKPGLQRAGIPAVRISWQPMNDGGLGWASSDGQIAIKDSIRGLQAERTAILELGHSVDYFYMTSEMRKAVIKLWNPNLPDDHEWFGSTAYWDQIGEAYSTLFLWAFADEELWFDAGYSHKPSRELAIQLRAILLPDTIAKENGDRVNTLSVTPANIANQ